MIVIVYNLSIGKITPKHFRFRIPQRRKIDLMTEKYHKQHYKTDNSRGNSDIYIRISIPKI